MMLQGIQTGEISMVIGTQSLIAESVEFSALRIAVVDEQHRFGVIQRGRFNSKVVHISLFRILIWLHYGLIHVQITQQPSVVPLNAVSYMHQFMPLSFWF
jgi:ATP-dependent DNA helicase RecG